jgi:hypothetical protein
LGWGEGFVASLKTSGQGASSLASSRDYGRSETSLVIPRASAIFVAHRSLFLIRPIQGQSFNNLQVFCACQILLASSYSHNARNQPASINPLKKIGSPARKCYQLHAHA